MDILFLQAISFNIHLSCILLKTKNKSVLISVWKKLKIGVCFSLSTRKGKQILPNSKGNGLKSPLTVTSAPS